MQMSYGEIVRSYKEAKEPKKQIGILADLNAVGKDEIAKILYNAGEINKMTYGQYQRHGKYKQLLPDRAFCHKDRSGFLLFFYIYAQVKLPFFIHKYYTHLKEYVNFRYH